VEQLEDDLKVTGEKMLWTVSIEGSAEHGSATVAGASRKC
jgi:hypothetical protein